MNIGMDEHGHRRSVVNGRYVGRFVYTVYDPSPADSAWSSQYLVSRVSDGVYLGVVRRQAGTGWWHPVPPPGPLTPPPISTAPASGRQSRREWAADELDAVGRAEQWCACGNSVAAHDRPTRAAMRAWASWSADPGGTARDDIAWQAAYHARYRGRHYDLTSCVTHAKRCAGPYGGVEQWLVKPGLAPSNRVLIRWDPADGSVAVTHWIGDQHDETYQYPFARSIEWVRDVYRDRGYVPVYEWKD